MLLLLLYDIPFLTFLNTRIEFIILANCRSPSPEPIYDANGKRLNTREVRKRQELEQRRHEKIQTLIKLNPEYKPPADYRS